MTAQVNKDVVGGVRETLTDLAAAVRESIAKISSVCVSHSISSPAMLTQHTTAQE